MTAVGLSLPVGDAEALAGEAARYGHAVVLQASGPAELAARIAAMPVEERPALVVARADAAHLDADLVAACDRRGIRILLVAQDAAEARYAAALGFVDTVATASWAALSGARAAEPTLADVTAQLRAQAGGRRGRGRAPIPPDCGAVIAVWGPHGAPGRTSVAIALAAELATRGMLVAVGDADTHAASVAPALGLLDEAPGFAAACRLAGIGGLSRAEFERVAEWVPMAHGGMWALTGIGRPARWPELTAERVRGAIEAARDWVGALVLDTAASIERDEELQSDLAAPRRNAATLAALAAADHVVLVGAGDAVGLSRLVRAHAELRDLLDAPRATVVVTKVRAAAVGVAPQQQVRHTLERFGGVADPVLVPWDPAAFDAALLAGRSVVDAAPRSPARVAIRILADRVLADLAGGAARASGYP